MTPENAQPPEAQHETPTSSRDLVGCDDLLASFNKVKLTDPIVHNGLKSGATLEQIIVALSSVRQQQVDRIIELERLAPKKHKMPETQHETAAMKPAKPKPATPKPTIVTEGFASKPKPKPDSAATSGRVQRFVSQNFGFAVNVFMSGFLTNSVWLRLMEGNYSYIGLPIALLALFGASAILHIIIHIID